VFHRNALQKEPFMRLPVGRLCEAATRQREVLAMRMS
jgi:hypothetical protein